MLFQLKQEQTNGRRYFASGRIIKQQQNFVPLPYRRVSFQPYHGDMSEVAITAHLLNREVYRRTDVIVLHNTDNQYAVAAVQRLDSDNLFTRLAAVEVLALPADCVYLHDANTDVANPSALAKNTRPALPRFDKLRIASVGLFRLTHDTT
ncbi:MAG: hypothetical protein EXR80_09830 [Methylococcales bacterium]|nr:hypothetical protein [Methylococcales bacterium]